MSDDAFQGYAVLELMGHRRLAGHVSEQTVAGAAFVRIDVPIHPWRDGCTCGSANPGSDSYGDHDHTCQRFREEDDTRLFDVGATQLYAPAAVYCITPCTEQVARTVAERTFTTPAAMLALPAPVNAEPHGLRQCDTCGHAAVTHIAYEGHCQIADCECDHFDDDGAF